MALGGFNKNKKTVRCPVRQTAIENIYTIVDDSCLKNIHNIIPITHLFWRLFGEFWGFRISETYISIAFLDGWQRMRNAVGRPAVKNVNMVYE